VLDRREHLEPFRSVRRLCGPHLVDGQLALVAGGFVLGERFPAGQDHTGCENVRIIRKNVQHLFGGDGVLEHQGRNAVGAEDLRLQACIAPQRLLLLVPVEPADRQGGHEETDTPGQSRDPRELALQRSATKGDHPLFFLPNPCPE